MSGMTAMHAAGADAAVQATGQGRRWRLPRLRRRHLWIIPGLAIAIYANTLGQANGVGILALIAFGIAPDLPRLFGTRARPMHNVLHQPVAAIAAVAITVTGVVPTFWLVGALVWLGHLIIGWGVGDVPRRGGNGSDA